MDLWESGGGGGSRGEKTSRPPVIQKPGFQIGQKSFEFPMKYKEI